MKDTANAACFTIAAAVVIAWVPWSSTRAAEYTVTPIGYLSFFQESHGWNINAGGQVVGNSQINGRDEHGFVWDSVNGIMDLGTLGGRRSDALGINTAGQVVGGSWTSSNTDGIAFVWDPVNGMQNLGWGSASYARAINDSGVAVGSANDVARVANVNGSGGTDIGPGAANDINNAGQVVGQTGFAPSPSQAFLWDPVNHTQLLGFLSGTTTSGATAINDLGQVVGFSDNHAFLWDSVHGMQDLGLFRPTDINNAGQVVGDTWLWDNVHGMRDLNSLIDPASGWTISGFPASQTAINDSGQIVATGIFSGGGLSALLLTPIPEPGGILLAGLGFLGFVAWCWRRQH